MEDAVASGSKGFEQYPNKWYNGIGILGHGAVWENQL